MSDRSTLDELREILDGITYTEGEYKNGWWETSTGADFGADTLEKVLDWGQRALGLPATDNHKHHWVDYGYSHSVVGDLITDKLVRRTDLPYRYRCRCGTTSSDDHPS